MAKINKVLMLEENLSVLRDARVWPEARALREAGYQVSVICPKGIGQEEEAHSCVEDIHIYRYRLPTLGNKYMAYIAEYSIALLFTFILSLKVLIAHGFDVIHTANPPDIFFLIGLFYRLFGKKFIFDQHDLSPEMFKTKFNNRKMFLYKFQLVLEKFSYRTAHMVITSNTSQKMFAIERGHCPASKVFVVRNGPDWNYVQTTPEMDLKKGWNYLLAYVGVMNSQDGIEYALYALHDLVYKRGRLDVSLVLMGDGDEAPTLRALAHDLKLEEYVNFAGWVDKKDVQKYLLVADVGLTPDPQNGLNEYSTMIKTMEYMSMGIPIVAFDLPETRYTAQDAALYAIPNLVEDFTQKIETLLNDKELRCQMGALGRKRIEEELSWEQNKKILLSVYETLFPGESKPPVTSSVKLLTRS
jgi:glycosyltransferase involved in cell wall biosynthesis